MVRLAIDAEISRMMLGFIGRYTFIKHAADRLRSADKLQCLLDQEFTNV